MSVSIVLFGVIVAVLPDRCVGSKALQLFLVIPMQAILNITDQKNTIAAACRSNSLPTCLLSDWGELITPR